MTDLIVVPQAAHWQRLKRLVLDSVSSPITRRVYNLGLDEFFEWYEREPQPGFTKATVCAWRIALEARGLGAVSINVRITAARRLAVEAVPMANPICSRHIELQSKCTVPIFARGKWTSTRNPLWGGQSGTGLACAGEPESAPIQHTNRGEDC